MTIQRELGNVVYDNIAIDYIWNKACEINNLIPTKIEGLADLYSHLTRMCTSQESQRFMHEHSQDNNSPSAVNRFINSLYAEACSTCLTYEDFYWIDNNNKRLLRYIWKLLGYLVNDVANYTYSFNYQFKSFSATNNSLITTRMTGVTIENVKKENIVQLLNRLKISKPLKLNVLEQIKYMANTSLNHRELTNWLEKDAAMKISWAQDYLHTTLPSCIPMIIPGSRSVELEIISFFDVLCTFNEDKFKLIVINMKKAWNQRTFREKNKHKKQYSINMSHDIEGILDKISNMRNENKNAIVEALIRDEHERISKN